MKLVVGGAGRVVGDLILLARSMPAVSSKNTHSLPRIRCDVLIRRREPGCCVPRHEPQHKNIDRRRGCGGGHGWSSDAIKEMD